MPLDVVRFAQSDLVAFAPPEAIVAAILLWGASWHQRPAGSLTNDDRSLANLAGYGRAVGEWLKVKDDALRGFVTCSDGRLYHPVVAEKVREAWLGRLKQRWRTYCSAVRMHNSRNGDDDQRNSLSFEEWLEHGRPDKVAHAPKAARQVALPLECDAQPDTMLRATPDDVARSFGGKGEGEGEGQGEGKGDSKEHDNREAPAAKVADDVFDFVGVADRLTRLAGIPNTQPSAINRNLQTVREWREAGVDIDAVVVPVIDRFRQDKPDERVSTLRFFDQSVRAALAAAERKAKGKPHRSAMSAPPVKPLGIVDQDDTRIRTIRGHLNGKPEHAPDTIALALEEHGDDATLVITARSSFAATRVDRDLFAKLAHQFVAMNCEVTVRHP
jgi:hypothetical protein